MIRETCNNTMSIPIPTHYNTAAPPRPCHHAHPAETTAHHLLHHHSHLLLAILSLVQKPSSSLVASTCAIGHLVLNPPNAHHVHRLCIAWANRLLFYTPSPPDLLSECTQLNDMYPHAAHIISPLALSMLALLPTCTLPSVYQSASNQQGFASAGIPVSYTQSPSSSVLIQPFFIHWLLTTGPFRSRAHILAQTRGGAWGPPTHFALHQSRTWTFAPDAFLLLSYYVRLGHAKLVYVQLHHMLRIDPLLAHVRAPVSVWAQASLDLRLASWLAVDALVVHAGNPQVRVHEWVAYVAAGDVAVHVLEAVEQGVGERVQVSRWPDALVGALVGRLARVRVEAKDDNEMRERLAATVEWLKARGVRVVLSGEHVG